jgi:hypothetical protein
VHASPIARTRTGIFAKAGGVDPDADRMGAVEAAFANLLPAVQAFADGLQSAITSLNS